MIPRGYKVCGKEEIGSGVLSLYSLIKLVGGQRHRCMGLQLAKSL